MDKHRIEVRLNPEHISVPKILKANNKVLIVLAALNLLVIAVMQHVGESLKPGNIILFEFAGNADGAHEMIEAWRRDGAMDELFFLLGLDYLFMLTYGSFLWIGCMKVAANLNNQFTKSIVILAWFQPVAALLDAVENFALYNLAQGSTDELWPALSFYCAGPKFAIAISAFLVWIISTAWVVIKKTKFRPVD